MEVLLTKTAVIVMITLIVILIVSIITIIAKYRKEWKLLQEQLAYERSGRILDEVRNHDFLFGIQLRKLYDEFLTTDTASESFIDRFTKRAVELVRDAENWRELLGVIGKFRDFSESEDPESDREPKRMLQMVFRDTWSHIERLYEREVRQIAVSGWKLEEKMKQYESLSHFREQLAQYGFTLVPYSDIAQRVEESA